MDVQKIGFFKDWAVIGHIFVCPQCKEETLDGAIKYIVQEQNDSILKVSIIRVLVRMMEKISEHEAVFANNFANEIIKLLRK